MTAEALEPYRRPQRERPAGNPAPLPYLLDAEDQARGAFDIELEVLLRTAWQREHGVPAQRLASSSTAYMYWTIAQMVAHHSSNGCELAPGDLFGTGTISGPERGKEGSLMEATLGGRRPLVLDGGETRTFLEDGDEVFFIARCVALGLPPLGFGECHARVID